jgi:O-methyltransferase
MNTQTQAFGTAQPVRHPWREVLCRARDPRFVADSALRVMMRGWDLVSPSEFSRLYRRVRTHTMCSNARLRGLYRALHYVVNHNIAGDVVECGSAKGGSAALMALTLRELNSKRKLWLFDTFEGLPAPTSKDPDLELADLFTGTCIGTLSEVRELFQRFEVLEGVEFVKGLFQQVLPVTPVPPISVLHIDGDWYESVKACLDFLYDKVVPYGVIQFDDYGYWKGTRKAVDEFFKQRGIHIPLRRLDYSGRFLIKPGATSDRCNTVMK